MAKASLKIFTIFFLLTVGLSCSRYEKLLKSEDPALVKKVGDDLYDKKIYDKAILFYEKALPVYMGSSQSEDLFFKIGYCYFKLNEFPTAAFHLKNFVDRFPGSKYEEEAYYSIAECYNEESPVINLDQHNSKKAIDAYQLYLDKYPQNTRIEEINKKMDAMNFKIESKAYDNAYLYYKIQDFKSSLWALKKFNLEFPGSIFKEKADYYAIQSAYLLAINGQESKQKERLKVAIEMSLDFYEKYPKSDFSGKVTEIQKTANSDISKL